MWEGTVGLILGMLVGGAIVGLWLQRGGGSGQSVAELKRENARFREDVNEHFVQTAELINQLTDSYKAVFDHLSDGAEKLVDAEVVRERMPQVTDEEVRLKRIGSPRPAETEQAPEDEPEPPSEAPAEATTKPQNEAEPEADELAGEQAETPSQEAKEPESKDPGQEEPEKSQEPTPDQPEDPKADADEDEEAKRRRES